MYLKILIASITLANEDFYFLDTPWLGIILSHGVSLTYLDSPCLANRAFHFITNEAVELNRIFHR